MKERRKDSKGRLLERNERQRPDGRYEFRYIDSFGKKHSVYSWRLTKSDRAPNGRISRESLREIEKRVLRDLDDGVITDNTVTVEDYYHKCFDNRPDLRAGTKKIYGSAYECYIKNKFGNMRICKITENQIKNYYTELILSGTLKISRLATINRVLDEIFKVAVKDNLIKKEPNRNILSYVKKVANETPEKRHSLTYDEEKYIIKCCKEQNVYKKYYPFVIFLLGTGCRVGEAMGLMWEDCDFANNVIYIRHNLQMTARKDDSWSPELVPPKTKAGERTIPMLPVVRDALFEEKKKQEIFGSCVESVSGFDNFVFINDKRRPFTQAAVTAFLRGIRSKACKLYGCEIRPFSAHNLRHTFCSRLCEQETDLKIIQEIMGHSSISTTMDIYNEVSEERKQESFKNLNYNLAGFDL